MPRIVSGAARGRPLAVPAGSATRPTSDRAREGLFSTLTALVGPLEGAAMLDLYAGSGAVGLEGLSRGAAHVVFVESDARALRTLRANLRTLGLPGGLVVAGRVASVVAAGPVPVPGGPAPPRHDLAFLDPPYATSDDQVCAVLLGLSTGGWLADGAVVAVERPSRGPELSWPLGYEALRARRYGEGTLWYGRAAEGDPHAGTAPHRRREVVERSTGHESRREA